jgi:glycine cleavage system transcriptional repressor
MTKSFVLTFSGPDRIGIVEEVTRILLENGGNVETSRMARLGGEFAMLVLVSLVGDQLEELEKDLEKLSEEGYIVTTSLTEEGDTDLYAGWLPYKIELHGADHEGIVHEVAAYLSESGINIESMDTALVRAPMSGTPLFTMSADVVVHPDLNVIGWQDALKDVGHRLDVDIQVSAANK